MNILIVVVFFLNRVYTVLMVISQASIANLLNVIQSSQVIRIESPGGETTTKVITASWGGARLLESVVQASRGLASIQGVEIGTSSCWEEARGRDKVGGIVIQGVP